VINADNKWDSTSREETFHRREKDDSKSIKICRFNQRENDKRTFSSKPVFAFCYEVVVALGIGSKELKRALYQYFHTEK